MHGSLRTVTSQSANHVSAFGGERDALHTLLPRQIRLCAAVARWHAEHGCAPPIKLMQQEAYGRERRCLWADVRKCVAAGVLQTRPGMGLRSLRPTPAFRLAFTDMPSSRNGSRAIALQRAAARDWFLPLRRRAASPQEDHHV